MKKMITTLAFVSTLALAGAAGAQSTSTNAVTPVTPPEVTTLEATGTSSVGVPNTGSGGEAAMNYAILAASAAVAIGAGAFALRSRRTL